MTSAHADVADGFFLLGTSLFLAKFWTWEDAKSRFLLALVTAVSLVMLLVTCAWNHDINNRWPMADRSTKIAPPPIGPAPAVPPVAVPPSPPAEPDGILTLTARIIHPGSPAIVVENASSKVAQGVIWELILWRESDSSYFSLPTQNIGFVKPHSKSAPYEMFAPGFAKVSDSDGRLIDGDSLTGTLSVDCPDCKGNTYIVHIVWGHGGWFHMIKGMNGKLAVPKEMTKEGIKQYITGLDSLIATKDKRPIV